MLVRTGKLAQVVGACAFGLFASAQQADAVVFDGRNLPPCYTNDSPFVPPLKQRTTIAVELWLCEETNHFSAIFVGDFIDTGESLALSWKGQFWRGNLTMMQARTASFDRVIEARGTAQHIVPGPGSVWEFGPIEGGGTGDRFLSTRDADRGAEPHGAASDVFTALFLMDEGRALFNFAGLPPHNVVNRGWTIEVTGRHGPGPFDFFGPKKPFEVELAVVSLPWAAPMLGASLALIFVSGRLRRKR